MSWGCPAYSCKDLPYFEGLSTEEMLSLLRETAASQAWSVLVIGNDTLRISVPFSLWSYGETVTVTAVEKKQNILFRSACIWPLQIFDWGKNEQNLTKLVAYSTFAFEKKYKHESV